MLHVLFQAEEVLLPLLPVHATVISNSAATCMLLHDLVAYQG